MASWTITEPQRLDIDEEIKRLEVSLVAGRLSVVGTDGPARVEITSASEIELTVSVDNGVLSVRHNYPKTWPGVLTPIWWWLAGRRRFTADVSIAVPYQVDAVLRMASGPVVASAINGDLAVDCTSGRIALLGIDGRIFAKVISGPIEALGCAGDIRVETISGEITLADSAAERLTAKTTSGAVTADLDNPPHNSEINLDTVSGEITVRVREDSDLTVHLAATAGRVTSAFPNLRTERNWGTSVHGVLGAGTGKLYANAISGSISLLVRPVDNEFGGAGPGTADEPARTDEPEDTP